MPDNFPLPLIHLNGSSKSKLLEDIMCVSVLLSDAQDKMQWPHMRDYYPLGDEGTRRFEASRALHKKWYADIEAIRQSMDRYALAIASLPE